MRIELLPGLTNVIRFPVERRARPTLDLLREIAPDAREVGSAIEAFGLQDPTVGLREAVDANTADHIANHVRDEPGKRRQAALAELLEVVLKRAVTAYMAAARGSHQTGSASVADDARMTLSGKTPADGQQERIWESLSLVKPLAAEFYRVTKKPLGVTGQIAEYLATDLLGLVFVDARTPGYDAIRDTPGRAPAHPDHRAGPWVMFGRRGAFPASSSMLTAMPSFSC